MCILYDLSFRFYDCPCLDFANETDIYGVYLNTILFVLIWIIQGSHTFRRTKFKTFSRLFPDFFQTISVIFKTGFYHIL